MGDHSIVSDFVWYLGELTDEERKEVFEHLHRNFCKHCFRSLNEDDEGETEVCQCWNDD